MAKLKKPKVQRRLTPAKVKRLRKLKPVDPRTKKYHANADYRASQQERARSAYRRKQDVRLSSCLYSLEFVEDMANRRDVNVPLDGGETDVQNLPVFTVPQAAAVLQKTYQTVWRWVKDGRIPEPVLVSMGRGDRAYHLEEVRIIIEEVGKHGKGHAYYRADHTDVSEEISRRILLIRKQLGWRS